MEEKIETRGFRGPEEVGRSDEPTPGESQALDAGDGGSSDEGGDPGGGREREENGDPREEEGVVADPVLNALERGGEEVERRAGSVRRGEESKVSEIVPGGGGHPGILGFGALSADKTGGVGDAKGADGANVEEEGVVDILGNESVAEVLMEGRRFGDGNSAGATKRDSVSLTVERGGATLNEKRVAGTPRVEARDGENDSGSADGGGAEPVEGGSRLGVVMGRIAFQFVNELVGLEAETVQVGVERDGGEGRLGGDNKRGIKSLELWGAEEEVNYLRRRVIHEGVMHESGLGLGKTVGGGGVAGGVFGGEAVVVEIRKVGVLIAKFLKF